MMRQWIIACGVAVVMLPVAGAQMTPPQPGPENKHLEHFVGTWKIEGTMKASPMGPGGPFTG